MELMGTILNHFLNYWGIFIIAMIVFYGVRWALSTALMRPPPDIQEEIISTLLDEHEPAAPLKVPKPEAETPVFECPKCGAERQATPCEWCGTSVTE